MLQRAAGLGAPQLAAVADLERRVVAADGGRLKLEWGTLRARSGDRVEDLLWWDGDRLAGFLGLYSFGAPAVELAGMVDPERRRQGIATALVDAALPCARSGRTARSCWSPPAPAPAVTSSRWRAAGCSTTASTRSN